MRMQELPSGTEVYFSFDDYYQVLFAQTFLEYIGKDIAVRTAIPGDPPVSDINTEGAFVFFVAPEDEATVQILESAWVLDGPYETPHEVTCPNSYHLYFVQEKL